MKISFTDRESDVMQVLWDQGPSVVATVRGHLKDELAYTTVLTVLRTLEAKGYVGHDEEGRGHRYFAKVKQQAARKSALRHLTDKLFQGSAEALFMHFVSDQKLSGEQIKRMRDLLAEKAADKAGDPATEKAAGNVAGEAAAQAATKAAGSAAAKSLGKGKLP